MKPTGDLHGVSRFTASRCMHKVARAIYQHKDEFIQWPLDAHSTTAIKTDFFEYSAVNNRYKGMPGVLGAVDGTHIKIATPTEDEAIFVNRKNCHTINAQIVSDCKLRILDINCNWPGSTHDAFIIRNSHVWEII